MSLQLEFIQAQMQAMTEQAKDLNRHQGADGQGKNSDDLLGTTGPFRAAQRVGPRAARSWLFAFVRSVLFWMIAERCSNAGSILDHLILLHPDIELLNFGNPKILQMLRCLFESCFRGLFPRGRAAANKADYSVNTHENFPPILSATGVPGSGGIARNSIADLENNLRPNCWKSVHQF
jgi:hypothetical protein